MCEESKEITQEEFEYLLALSRIENSPLAKFNQNKEEINEIKTTNL